MLATAGAVLLGFGGFVLFQRTRPLVQGEGCLARVGGQAIELDTDQAAVAATIAGVGHRVGVPRQAVTVAFATALQESHLRNVDYGDRDSVGVFQQRPSQGWGTRDQLKDPVYASAKFFSALVKVRGYARMPVDRAAQAVQHSADGTAYRQYGEVAGKLSMAFTGGAARAVWCWYQSFPGKRKVRLTAATTELRRTFGAATAGTVTATYRATAVTAAVPAETAGRAAAMRRLRTQTQTQWAIASWAVAHAKIYGIKEVEYAGYVWRASKGQLGWRPGGGSAADRVQLR